MLTGWRQRHHYFVPTLSNPSAPLAAALRVFNDATQRRAAVDACAEPLTPLEELLLTLDVPALDAALAAAGRPELAAAAAAPACGFTQSFLDLPPPERAARPAQEAAFKALAEEYRTLARLRRDAEQLRRLYGPGGSAPPQRQYAPFEQPPPRVAFEVDQAEPKDEPRSAADAKAEIDDVDHTRCCLQRVVQFKSLYAS